MKISLFVGLAAAALAGPVLAQSPAPGQATAGSAAAAARVASAPGAAVPTSSAAANDYGQGSTWLCRPGRRDACAQDQTATVVAGSGKLSREAYAPMANAKIDCFYVYPTVSADPTPNSDMVAGVEEQRVIEQQFARFGARCRQFAPLYRQVTLTALRAGIVGTPMTVDRGLAYKDVVDAWRYYLAHDNGGRGFVLIGHSQGSGLLTRLIKEEIDGKPIQRQLVSAILAGTNLAPPGSGPGAYTAVPVCTSSAQIGCVIAFASFRANAPPPANSRFGKVQGAGGSAACVNPAALGGGSGALDAYLSNRVAIADSAVAPAAWVKGGPAVTTPFVKVPGLLTAQCVQSGGANYLAVTVNADPADPRVDDITGDVVTAGQVQRDWGLHLIDVNMTMGNLLSIVGDQTKTYLARK